MSAIVDSIAESLVRVMMRVLPLVMVFAVVAMGVVLPRPQSVGDPSVIKIVSSLPRSGSAKGQTDTIVEGIRLALQEVDYKVTSGGTEFTIIYRDLDDATAAAGAWTAEQEISNANLARNDPDVMVYIGTYNSGAAKLSMPILNKARLLMVSPANTAEGLTKPGMGDRAEPMCYRPTGEVNYTRVVPTDDLQGALGADWTQDLGCKKVFVLDDTEVYGKGIADRYEARARAIGLEVLGHESIDVKAQEFSALMTKIKLKGPDMIYFGGTTQSKAGQIAKDMVKAGLDQCKMMGPDGCYEDAMITSAGAETLIGRFHCTFGGLTPDRLKIGEGKKFVEKYEAAFGNEPSEAYAIYGYECGRVAIEAIQRAGRKDRAAICIAGRSIKNFAGASGIPWSFDENGDTTLQLMTGSTVKMVHDPKTGQDTARFVWAKDLTPRPIKP
jgi:branched-chain amino acid transport system substrate-binding protein